MTHDFRFDSGLTIISIKSYHLVFWVPPVSEIYLS